MIRAVTNLLVLNIKIILLETNQFDKTQRMSKRKCKIQKTQSFKQSETIHQEDIVNFQDLDFVWKKNEIFRSDSFSQSQISLEQNSLQDTFLQEHEQVLKKELQRLQSANILKQQNQMEQLPNKNLKNQIGNQKEALKFINKIEQGQVKGIGEHKQLEKLIPIKKSEKKIVNVITKIFPKYLSMCIQSLTISVLSEFSCKVKDTKNQGDILDVLIYQIKTFSEKIRSNNLSTKYFHKLQLQENAQLFRDFLLKWSYTILAIKEGYFQNIYYDGQRRHYYNHEDQESDVTDIEDEQDEQQFISYPSKKMKPN